MTAIQNLIGALQPGDGPDPRCRISKRERSISSSGTGDERALLALAGRVPVKVTAEAAAIASAIC
ncbi:MAG: hypothetical protein DMG64_17750 [Acidobacteria bacterium]|nr:MAG: hypothetical protein DMG63_10865 [Acidobacteriota bacterium]PYY00085.1 MAG: hypothetical protein DMG64_17750 [Acidobacteriota bacterium]PYY20997.1 MAG: hypothetical protein DMG62_20875 [Acidobacteriota bacterium]